MFELLKKALFGARRPAGPPAQPSQFAAGPASEWAATKGFGFTTGQEDIGLSFQGNVQGHPWRMQVGAASRKYIRGEEVRARAELGVDESVSVLVINRPLKEALERQAYSLYTDSVQTSVDRNLPEEMRWLAIYDEVGWDDLPPAFWARFAVLTDSRENAAAWILPALGQLLVDWPEPAPSEQVPFVLMLMRGKVYLRMEYSPSEFGTVQHATQVFTSACEAAVTAFPKL